MKEARFVSQTFYRAYDQEIKSLSDTLTQGKYSSQQTSVPDPNVNKTAPQLGLGPLIKLSRDQLQMTICRHTPGSSIKLDSASKKLISHRKF